MLGSKRVTGIILIGAVAITALILPQAASAWLLNLANLNLARAASLPMDAPARADALSAADAQLGSARAFVASGWIALAQMRAALAGGDALRATQIDPPSDFIAQFWAGNAAWQMGNQDAAWAAWRAAGAFEYFIQQAHRASFQHDWGAAEQWARIAVGIAPASADAHFVLGDALSQQSVANIEAIQELNRAADLTHDQEFLSTALTRHGEILAARGDYAGAIEYYNRAIRVAPLDARPRTGLARVWLEPAAPVHGDADALLKQVVTDSPWAVSAFVLLAQNAERWHNDPQGAEAWYRAGLEKNPHDPLLLFERAEFYARTNRWSEAKANYVLALQYETHADQLQLVAHRLAAVSAP